MNLAIAYGAARNSDSHIYNVAKQGKKQLLQVVHIRFTRIKRLAILETMYESDSATIFSPQRNIEIRTKHFSTTNWPIERSKFSAVTPVSSTSCELFQYSSKRSRRHMLRVKVKPLIFGYSKCDEVGPYMLFSSA